MPKLRRRLRVGGVNLILPANLSNNVTTNNTLNISNNNNINLISTDTSGGVSQASSSHSVRDDRAIIGELIILTVCTRLCLRNLFKTPLNYATINILNIPHTLLLSIYFLNDDCNDTDN